MSTLAQPSTSRTGAAHAQRVEDALSLIAPKWTNWVVQTLAQARQPMRVREIARQLPFVSEQLVGRRLAQMHADGLVTRSEDFRAPYQLSGFGTSLAPVHQALTDWSHQHIHFPPGGVAGAERVEDAVRRLHLRHTTAVIQGLDAGPMRFVHIGEAVGLDDPYTRQRLVRLQADGLVARAGLRHGDPYTLTAAGRALGPVYAAVEHWSDPTAAVLPAATPTPAVIRTQNAIAARPDGIRTAAALRRSSAAPSGLFSHAPAPQPRVPATITAQSSPARCR
ncbi:winged helix-turn-helix transcriptional regulator [Actinacidiphila paucisporea]|uniref:Transcriptional regulator, HxlR family n=1 Tax=Actinacidiphila paucisporea TaxID=310782 RepID=A0A1M7PZQ3_9ACTN|nr:winged helix-turn-helix transcriptional regulator [Actinacidiphila paucisporea]SHN23184.1 transcriptional regulator, HxlR family [Actinacidiphila paucisporea]